MRCRSARLVVMLIALGALALAGSYPDLKEHYTPSWAQGWPVWLVLAGFVALICIIMEIRFQRAKRRQRSSAQRSQEEED